MARDLDAVPYGTCYGTAIRVHGEHTLDGLAVLLGYGQAEGYVDALDHEHLTLELYLSNSLGGEPGILQRHLTRSQRAGKGAEQSAARGGDHVVQGRRVRLLLVRRYSIVLSHLAVHAERNRIVLCGYTGLPDRALNRVEIYPRDVCYIWCLCQNISPFEYLHKQSNSGRKPRLEQPTTSDTYLHSLLKSSFTKAGSMPAELAPETPARVGCVAPGAR